MVTCRAPAGKTGRLGPCPDPSRSSALAPSFRRWPPSTPTSSPPPAVADRASSSCRPRPSSEGEDGLTPAGPTGGSSTSGPSGPRSRRSRSSTGLRRRRVVSPGDRRGRPRLPRGRRARHLLGGTRRQRGRAAIVDAHDRGAVIAGCRRARWPWSTGSWACAARVLPGRSAGATGSRSSAARSCPGYDRMPEPLAALLALQAPRGTAVLGIDEGTAIVGRDGSWQVHGRPGSRSGAGRRRERLRAGDVFRA